MQFEVHHQDGSVEEFDNETDAQRAMRQLGDELFADGEFLEAL